MPVTVRVAPPDVTKYSPPERQKILSNVCHTDNRSPTSVVQVLREISLKRHASTEDVNFDVAKKQRTEFFNEEREMILEENRQKRSRDDSSKSDEDLSPQNKSVRPAKRTKTRSCYDILNSLSSSVHVAAGVKRKAGRYQCLFIMYIICIFIFIKIIQRIQICVLNNYNYSFIIILNNISLLLTSICLYSRFLTQWYTRLREAFQISGK